jgi:DNA (cytosine-5)-methyltransferase 1
VHTAVDLFAGPGGLDLAARANGLNPIGYERDPDACATRHAAGLPTVEDDVRKHGPGEHPAATVLLGGPPCQPFSAAGNGKGRRELDTVLAAVRAMLHTRRVPAAQWDDPRTGLVLQPLRWILEAIDTGRPYRTIVLEQVPAVLPVWEAYADVLGFERYNVHFGVLRAEEHGVPQTRRRAFLIASLDGRVSLPDPTHRPYVKGVPQNEGDPTLLPWVSMGDVLSKSGPFTAVSNYGTGGDPKARGRRTSDEPAFTVTGKISRVRLVRGDVELPRFGMAEAGRLQGFPAGFPWRGRDIGKQIGNACPVQLGTRVIAAALAPTRTAVAA